MKCVRVLAYSFLLLPIGMSVADQSVKIDQCESSWKKLFRAKNGRVDDSLLEEWKNHERECKGTRIYEIHLASIYLRLEKFEPAKIILQSATIPQQYKLKAEIVGVNIDYLQAISFEKIDLSALRRLEARIVSLKNEQQDVSAVLGILGHVQLLLGKYPDAVDTLEKVVANRIDGDDLTDYRNLTVAYANVERYEEALALVDKTYSLSKDVTSDKEFMYAAALAYSAVGNVESAKNMLTLILNKNPGLENDLRYRQVVSKAKELSKGKLK